MNAFADNVLDAINSEEMQYARLMLLGEAPDRGSNQCSNCFVYHDMEKTGEFMDIEFVRGLVARTKSSR